VIHECRRCDELSGLLVALIDGNVLLRYLVWMRGRDLQEREGKGKKRPLLLRSAPQVKALGSLAPRQA
jgi:hypothetical protein